MLEKTFYSVADACTVFGCGKTRLYELLSAKKVFAKKLGRKTIIDAESIRKYFASLPDAQINVTSSRKLQPSLGDPPGDRAAASRQVSEKSAVSADRQGRGGA
jgi:hypothetical protein